MGEVIRFPDERRVHRDGALHRFNVSRLGDRFPMVSLLISTSSHVYVLPKLADLGAVNENPGVATWEHAKAYLVRAFAMMVGTPFGQVVYKREAYVDPAKLAPGGGEIHSAYGGNGLLHVEFVFEVEVGAGGNELRVNWSPSTGSCKMGRAECFGYRTTGP